MHDSEIQSLQSKLDQCESDNQDAIITKHELDLCRRELTDEQNSKQQIYQDLQRAKKNIKTFQKDKKILQNQLKSSKEIIDSEQAESKRLRDRTRKLEKEIQSLKNQNLLNRNAKTVSKPVKYCYIKKNNRFLGGYPRSTGQRQFR